NVPAVCGNVAICVDVSGSMSAPVTGFRKGGATGVRCVDVAALTAAAIVRKNPGAMVLPFEAKLVKAKINGRDSVMTNAEHLVKVCGGGTNCSAPLAALNAWSSNVDLVIFVSDNQSWVDAGRPQGTAMMI